MNYDRIPPAVLEALDRWGNHGIEAGHFTMAVLRNDLVEAMRRADENSRAALFEIVGYVYNELPSACWGSPERVKAWAEGFYRDQRSKDEQEPDLEPQ